MLKFSNLKNTAIIAAKLALKRVVLTVFTLCIGFSAYTQEMGVTANLILATANNDPEVGYGLNFFSGTKSIRGALELDFFPKKNFSRLEGSIFGHYLFSFGSKTVLYPLAGIGFGESISDFWSFLPAKYYFAFSLGGGLDHNLTQNFALNFEVRCKYNSGKYLSGYQTNFVMGMAYKF